MSLVSPDNHESGLVAVDLESMAAIEGGEDANVSLDVTDDSEIIKEPEHRGAIVDEASDTVVSINFLRMDIKIY